MAKDPAFLFYTDNFQSGTQFFTDEQLGKYVRLLCAQHLHGHLTEKQVNLICKTSDEEIMSKFTKDEEGKYYNKRLEIEILKRKAFSESRANNRTGKGSKPKNHIKKKSKRHVKDMEDGNEIENVVDIEIFLNHCREILQEKYSQYEFSLISKYETWKADGWRDGNGNEIRNWKNKINNVIPFLKPIIDGKSISKVDSYRSTRDKILEKRNLNPDGSIKQPYND